MSVAPRVPSRSPSPGPSSSASPNPSSKQSPGKKRTIDALASAKSPSEALGMNKYMPKRRTASVNRDNRMQAARRNVKSASPFASLQGMRDQMVGNEAASPRPGIPKRFAATHRRVVTDVQAFSVGDGPQHLRTARRRGWAPGLAYRV